MELNDWTRKLRAAYDKCLEYYRSGGLVAEECFSEEETAFLASIGLKPINVFDYAEDFTKYGEPDWETFLLVTSARRDFFLYKQDRQSAPETKEATLPPKDAALEGVAWLPRLIEKARRFLRGQLPHEIMYGCGGDRRFFKTHEVHPADFLRMVWAAGEDDQQIVSFVRKAAD